MDNKGTSVSNKDIKSDKKETYKYRVENKKGQNDVKQEPYFKVRIINLIKNRKKLNH